MAQLSAIHRVTDDEGLDPVGNRIFGHWNLQQPKVFIFMFSKFLARNGFVQVGHIDLRNTCLGVGNNPFPNAAAHLGGGQCKRAHFVFLHRGAWTTCERQIPQNNLVHFRALKD